MKWNKIERKQERSEPSAAPSTPLAAVALVVSALFQLPSHYSWRLQWLLVANAFREIKPMTSSDPNLAKVYRRQTSAEHQTNKGATPEML